MAPQVAPVERLGVSTHFCYPLCLLRQEASYGFRQGYLLALERGVQQDGYRRDTVAGKAEVVELHCPALRRQIDDCHRYVRRDLERGVEWHPAARRAEF